MSDNESSKVAPDIYDCRELAAELRKLEAKHGLPPVQLEQPKLAELLDFIIELHTANLHLDQEWRSGVIPTAPATVAGAPAS